MPPRLSPALREALPRTREEMYCRQAVILNAEVRAAAAAPPKKKGVKIVDGREVPFNLFKPKEPLKAKVIKNDKYPHTITTATGDANWETVHVTFDHGGKFPYLEGMSLGIVAPGPDQQHSFTVREAGCGVGRE